MRRIARVVAVALVLAALTACQSRDAALDRDGFPEFFTSAENYYVTRIGAVPEIDAETYQLEISGLVDQSRSYSLGELNEMTMQELPLTVECIGNSTDGALLSTAVWKGIPLYDFLASLGIDDTATGVRYEAADGYYATHTLEQIKDNNVLLALSMNDEPIPPLHGFPVRVLNPGYYGVKQPAWVIGIEVIDRPPEDYWNDRGWDVSPPIAIDSKIFSPPSNADAKVDEAVRITGAAFGGTRVARVEATADRGITWQDARIVRQVDADNVWVFWETEFSFDSPGAYQINIRATDFNGVAQQEDDPDRYDGQNDWPMVRVRVER